MNEIAINDQSVHVAIAYHSGFGHTARQAEAVARGAASVPATVVSLHDVGELTDELWEALDHADAIIFGTPTYMGSPSAVFKCSSGVVTASGSCSSVALTSSVRESISSSLAPEYIASSKPYQRSLKKM